MIVRILGEGQFSVPDTEKKALEKLDGELVTAVEARNEKAYHKALAALTATVRGLGDPVPADALSPSDLVVPFEDATLAETEALLADAAAGDDD